jgi:hypothetical protein
MSNNHPDPTEPRPHQLADWLHHQFLRRAAPPALSGPSPWPDSNLYSTLTHAVRPPIDLDFSRQDVKSARVGSALDRLMTLTDTPLACAQNASRLRLVFTGYEQERKEIAQIHDIAHYFQAITAHWPYWMHFLSPQVDNMATLLNLTFIPMAIDVDGDRVYSRLELSDKGIASFQKMTMATINLHNTMAAPLHITTTMGLQLRQALCQVLT